VLPVLQMRPVDPLRGSAKHSSTADSVLKVTDEHRTRTLQRSTPVVLALQVLLRSFAAMLEMPKQEGYGHALGLLQPKAMAY